MKELPEGNELMSIATFTRPDKSAEFFTDLPEIQEAYGDIHRDSLIAEQEKTYSEDGLTLVVRHLFKGDPDYQEFSLKRRTLHPDWREKRMAYMIEHSHHLTVKTIHVGQEMPYYDSKIDPQYTNPIYYFHPELKNADFPG
jgi:hypothetical protein